MKRIIVPLSLAAFIATASYWTQCASPAVTSAKLYIQQDNLANAEEQLLTALENEPQNAEVPYLLGSAVYAKQMRWEEMAEMFDRSLGISDQYSVPISNERKMHWVNAYNKGADLFNKAISGESGEVEANLVRAIEALETAIIIDPLEPGAHASLASAQLQTGDTEAAKKNMHTALELDPDNVPILTNLGVTLSKEERWEESNEYLERALEINPENVNALQRIAHNYDALGDSAKAEEAYLSAIEGNPENANLYYNLGVLYFRRDEGDRAEEMFLKALEINPDDCDAVMNVAITYLQDETKLEKAKEYLLRAIECEPDNARIHRDLATVYLKLGMPDEAEEAYERAKELGYERE